VNTPIGAQNILQMRQNTQPVNTNLGQVIMADQSINNKLGNTE